MIPSRPGYSTVVLPDEYGGPVEVPNDEVMNLLQSWEERTVAEGSAYIVVEDMYGNPVTIDLTDPAAVEAARQPDDQGFVLLPYEFV